MIRQLEKEAPGSNITGLEREDVSLEDEEEQELTLELEEILKTCSTTETKPKSSPSGASDSGKVYT